MAIVTTRDGGIPAAVDTSVAAMSRAGRGLCVAFVAVLALCLVVMLVETILAPAPLMPLDERRDPTPWPGWRLLIDQPSVFAERINRWFDDRVGLRDVLIRAKNQIDFSLFGQSRKAYLGTDGWLFERGTTDARSVFEHASEAEFRATEQSFEQFANLLARRGIKLVVVGYPDKSMLYPEYLPSNIPPLPSGRYNQLRRFLDSQRNITFIDAETIFRAAKPGGPLYYKTDIHPTPKGSIPVVKEIVRRIAAAEARSDIAWDEHFAWMRVFFEEGAEARFLAILSPFGEWLDTAPDFYSLDKKPPGGHWIKDARRIDVAGAGSLPIFDWEFVSDPGECAHRLPGTVLYGNSFSDPYVSLGLYNYFCFLRRARTPSGRFAPYVADIPDGTKYFIFEYTAPYLPGEAPFLKAAGAAPDPRQFWGAAAHD